MSLYGLIFDHIIRSKFCRIGELTCLDLCFDSKCSNHTFMMSVLWLVCITVASCS